MGVRSFLKGKMDKHGGAAGLVKAVATKPARMARGESTAAASRTTDLPKPGADGFLAVCKIDELKDGQPRTFDVRGATVAVFRTPKGLFAIDNACVHEDGPLGEGKVDGVIVTCPYHDWRYDVTSGQCLSEPERNVACFSVKDREGFVWVGAITRPGSDARGGEHDDGLKVKPI
jgi:nitrite reductase/ring-hydroxylating ferredoxin subunit